MLEKLEGRRYVSRKPPVGEFFRILNSSVARTEVAGSGHDERARNNPDQCAVTLVRDCRNKAKRSYEHLQPGWTLRLHCWRHWRRELETIGNTPLRSLSMLSRTGEGRSSRRARQAPFGRQSCETGSGSEDPVQQGRLLSQRIGTSPASQKLATAPWKRCAIASALLSREWITATNTQPAARRPIAGSGDLESIPTAPAARQVEPCSNPRRGAAGFAQDTAHGLTCEYSEAAATWNQAAGGGAAATSRTGSARAR